MFPASTIHVAYICGVAVAAVITEKLGRKKTITLLSIPIILNWVVLYYAEKMISYMISRIIIGACFGGVGSMCILSMAEYTLSNVRGFYICGIYIGTTVGVASAHLLGVLLHWRTAALLGVIPSSMSAILALFSVESPAWLASKGRFEDCRTAFRALHGSEKHQTELELLIETEKSKKQNLIKESTSNMRIVKFLIGPLGKRYFWKIALLGFILNLYRLSLSVILICTFILTILKDIVGNSDILLITFTTDALLILGSFSSSYLVRKMKMKSLLLLSGTSAVVLLLALSACLYFAPEKNSCFIWIKVALLGMYLTNVSAGPHPVLQSLFSEVYPLELKTYCMFIFGVLNALLLFTSTKIALPMFGLIGYHGVFLSNAALSIICLLYFWKYLPETKGRTLQEIELYFKNGTFDNVNTLLDEAHMNRLI